jgi:hypothetical protein
MGDWLQPHILLLVLLLGFPFVLILWVIPMWVVCKKAGFSPWLTLLNCIPFGTSVLLYLLAFADWRNQDHALSPDAASGDQPAPRAVRGPQLVVR